MAYTESTDLALKKAVPGTNQPFETAEMNNNWDKIDAASIASKAAIAAAQTDIANLKAGTAITHIDGGAAA